MNRRKDSRRKRGLNGKGLVRRTAHEAEKLIDSVRVQVAPVSRDIGLISRDVQSIAQFIHRQVDRVEDGIETVRAMVVRVKEFQFERTVPLRLWVSTRAP